MTTRSSSIVKLFNSNPSVNQRSCISSHLIISKQGQWNICILANQSQQVFFSNCAVPEWKYEAKPVLPGGWGSNFKPSMGRAWIFSRKTNDEKSGFN